MENKYIIKLLKDSVRRGNIETIKTVGFSMEPTIRQNDKITIKAYSSYSVGDIVVFEYKNQGLLVHRIIDIISNEFLCKGDNAIRIERITYEDILGKVIEINNIVQDC